LSRITSAKRHRCAEAEACKNDRALEFAIKPIESGKNVANFGFAIVRAFAQAGTAKVEAQHREAESKGRVIERLYGVVDNLVVKAAAEEGVRVANERGELSTGRAFVYNCFKSAGGS
jgi:phosphoglycerate dehydrogenase-like enzyme